MGHQDLSWRVVAALELELEAWPAEQSPSPGLWQSSLGTSFPQSRTQTQHKPFGLKATFIQGIMSRNTPKTEAAFSQPRPLCCPMNPGEPPRAHRILGHRAHQSITQTVLQSQAIIKLYYPTSHSLLASVHDKSQQSTTSSSSCQWITFWW